ncbi:MAG: AraC family transcriptional regulator [Crocinitomicaceae bacterium]
MKVDKVEKYHLLKDQPTSRQFEFYDLKTYLEGNLTHSSRPHSHSFYQIIWFKSNKGKHFVDFNSFNVDKDRIFFISKNQVHYFENHVDYEGYLIHFNESFILSNETDMNFFISYSIFNNIQEPYFQVPSDLLEELSSYVDQLSRESKNKGAFGNDSVLSNLLRSILILVERQKRKKRDANVELRQQNGAYLKFQDILERNHSKGWSVSDFAHELSISSKSLNALVKGETGKTVSQVIVDRIILEAKRKLTHSHAQIKQIGYDLGFSDPYYFNKYFKKHVKCSPSEFRKSIS